LFLLGGWGTTIAMFLQTLKFKQYISPNAAMVLYAGSFPFFYASWLALIVPAAQHAWLTALAAAGLGVNFGSRRAQLLWQSAMCALCLAIRCELLAAPTFSAYRLSAALAG
jgi:hypothetical protein